MNIAMGVATGLLLLLQPFGACTSADEPGASPSSQSSGTSQSTPGADETTLQGEVRSGVEAGCLVLRSAGKDYLLLGEPTEGLAPGDRVIVTGVPEPDVATECMQGTPFHVDTVELAD